MHLTIFNEAGVVQRLAGHLTSLQLTLHGAISNEQMHAICQLRTLDTLELMASRHGAPGTHGIAAIPAAISQLQSLTKLHLRHISNASSQQLALPVQLALLPSLKQLIVVRVTPGGLSTICRLSALEILVLSGPLVHAELPKSFTQLSRLSHLHLHSFHFPGSADALAGLPAVTSLAVMHVTVGAGQDVLSALTQLTKLDMKQSTFSCDAVHVAALTRLVCLSLEEMALTEFEVPSGLHCLQRLQLDGNRLRAVPSDLSRLSSLTGISISHQQGNLFQVPAILHPWHDLPALRYVGLVHAHDYVWEPQSLLNLAHSEAFARMMVRRHVELVYRPCGLSLAD